MTHEPALDNALEASAMLPSAPLTRRLGALVYDSLVVAGLWFVTALVAVIINGGEAVPPNLMRAALLTATTGFFLVFWMRGGQTLGMLSWRLRVQDVNGGPLTMSQCLLRLAVAVPSIGAAGLGLLWILVDPERRAWHDHASASRVVMLPKPAATNR